MTLQHKTIVVTGGAGFIGSRLCARLAAEGYHVVSLDNYFTGSRDNHVAGIEYLEGHTKEIETHIPQTQHIDLVYHLGEYSRVEISFTEPGVVLEHNIQGTAGVLEFCRKRHIKVVYAGSSTKFADGGLGRDGSPYAWTKATNTELVRNYGSWYGLPYAITYFYNVYGPGERAGSYGTVIEIFRQKYLQGESLQVVSPGTQKRNFTHVDDIVDGLLLVGKKGEGDEFGLGAKDAYSILEVANMFGGEVEMLPERQGNRMSAMLDDTRSRMLGWQPARRLPDYIKTLKV